MVVALAVVNSRDGTPIYLHDYSPQPTTLYYDDDELFGGPIITGSIGCAANDSAVPKDSTNLIHEWPCQLTFQFILHEAYVALYQILDTNQWKVPTTSGADGSLACWVGYLCSSSGFRCYGYVTTNVFYIVMVEDTIVPDDKENQLSRDRELCMLMVCLIVFLFPISTLYLCIRVSH
jgi:hypothetical protein